MSVKLTGRLSPVVLWIGKRNRQPAERSFIPRVGKVNPL